jgi:hypothetical protein
MLANRSVILYQKSNDKKKSQATGALNMSLRHKRLNFGKSLPAF